MKRLVVLGLSLVITANLAAQASEQQFEKVIHFASNHLLMPSLGTQVETQGKKYRVTEVKESKISEKKNSTIKAAIGENTYFAQKREFLVSRHIACEPLEENSNPIELCIVLKVNAMTINHPETGENILADDLIYSGGLAGVTLVNGENCVCSKF